MKHLYGPFNSLEKRTCGACSRPHREHHGLKCLFGPTSFTVGIHVYVSLTYRQFGCDGCGATYAVEKDEYPLSCPSCESRWRYSSGRFGT